MKPTLIITKENSRGTWALATAVDDCLREADQRIVANTFVSKLSQIHMSATEEQVLELVEQFVDLETEESIVAKTRAKSKMPKVDLIKASEVALDYRMDAEKVVELIEEMAVTNDTQYETAAEMCADVITQAKEIDEKRRLFVDPLNGVVKDLNNFFRPALDHLDTCEKTLKKKLSGYVVGEAKIRNDLLEKVSEEDPSTSEALIEQADNHVPPKIAGLSMRVTWTGEVVDAAKIPKEYLIPDVKALKALTKAKDGDPGIAGWKATPTTSPAITASKFGGGA